MEFFYVRLTSGKVPFSDPLVVVPEDNIVDVGDLVSPQVHRGHFVGRLPVLVAFHC